MFCKHCGKEINDNAVYCIHCGVATGVPSPFAPQAVQQSKTNAFAIVGFIFSILGLFIGYFSYDILPLLGLIFSIVGLVKSKMYGSGKGLSIAGIVISVLSGIVVLVILLLTFVLKSLNDALNGMAFIG